MAYQDVLTGTWHGNFRYFTRKQAGVIYGACKRGDVHMTRAQVSKMYDTVGNPDACADDYRQMVTFICDRRYDLAQALIDGHRVEWVETVETVDVLITQDMMDRVSDVFDDFEVDGYTVNFTDVLLGEVGDTCTATRVASEGWAIVA